ncbi:DUF202 domain-containing protein [Persicimonas caeni]|uniref:DUF202 domain-containing protein n=1 Tax=Persicimonas caeni TaxID=2292766 RepID=A0A4Y6Q059_PERCE|nr:DUF202 domain-containing protein [Persicimonas caeni]QDG53819.1 DUF202 domain-containing protein [Persicimonas caeni]QED35040.1 DUF202 domain-containing protein [Persicimonas caeni]
MDTVQHSTSHQPEGERRQGKSKKKLSRRTSLAFERSVAASDRTLMASLRTALSMISFGFAIFEGSTFLAQAEEWSAAGPQRLGWALVLGGTLLLFISLWEHVRYVRNLSYRTGNEMPVSGALVSAVIFLLLALLVIINWIFKLGIF